MKKTFEQAYAGIFESIKYLFFLIIISLLSFTHNGTPVLQKSQVARPDTTDSIKRTIQALHANRKAVDSTSTVALNVLNALVNNLGKLKKRRPKSKIVYVYITDTVYKKRPFLNFLKFKNKKE